MTSFEQVDFACPDVLEAFQKGNTAGIPEFRSVFYQDMADEVSPATFHEFIQLPGLAHGTGVWFDNDQILIQHGKPVSDVIAYRDDVFHYIQKKMERKHVDHTGFAYKIMEDTSRGVYAKWGISDELINQFSILGVEDWFAESIQKIRYLFPRAHGVLYVKYALILM